MIVTAQSEYGTLRRLLLKHPSEAFLDDDRIGAEWKELGFTAAPDYARAVAEYDAFVQILEGSGTEVITLPDAPGTGLDSIYVRDASIVCDRGIILCHMGKPQRRGEPAAQETVLRATGLNILGTIEPPGHIEGGDVAWLDARTLAVGRGYRTNDNGIRQLSWFLGDSVEILVVALPHWRGPADVFHLMSFLSPVDRNLAVVYSPLMPIPFRERLLARGYTLVEVPDDEFESMGANVLAVAPRRCVVMEGNPVTRRRLEAAGADVVTYEGREISLKGGGGPTCLTRPLLRAV